MAYSSTQTVTVNKRSYPIPSLRLLAMHGPLSSPPSKPLSRRPSRASLAQSSSLQFTSIPTSSPQLSQSPVSGGSASTTAYPTSGDRPTSRQINEQEPSRQRKRSYSSRSGAYATLASASEQDAFFVPSTTPHIVSPLSRSPTGSPRVRTTSLTKSGSASPVSRSTRIRASSSPHIASATTARYAGLGFTPISSGSSPNIRTKGSVEALPYVHGGPSHSLGTPFPSQILDSDDDAGVTFEVQRRKRPSLSSTHTRSRTRSRASSVFDESDAEVVPARPLPTCRAPTRSNPTSLDGVAWIRWLSVVPGVIGALYHLSLLLFAPTSSKTVRLSGAEHLACVLWALLTAYQGLSFATGLLHRWRFYYSLIPTVIRLLALQAIIWSATNLALRSIHHAQRPLICWAFIGTVSCVIKSIQLWSTSNLRGGEVEDLKITNPRTRPSTPTMEHSQPRITPESSWTECIVYMMMLMKEQHQYVVELSNDIHRSRHWDWERVLRKCIAPAAVVYFVMAWSLLLKREFVNTGTGIPC